MPRILFVCVENAGRSQMAEAFARKWAPPGLDLFSAGSHPAKQLHPVTVEVMREIGIDLAGRVPKGFNALPSGIFDVVVEMGCGDACPVQPAKRTVAWEIPNPKGQPLETARRIRDEIERKVRELLEAL